MRIRFTTAAILLILAGCGVRAASGTGGETDQASGEHNYVPPGGYVPDAQTAVRIAEAVLVPIYGQQSIDRQRPLVARLEEGRWTVGGTLASGFSGGVAVVELNRSDARILRVSHGR